MKQVLSALMLIAVVISLSVGGTVARWVESDAGTYSFQAGEWQYDQSGTIGFWKGPAVFNHFGENAEGLITFWLEEIDDDSDWLGPTTYEDMVILLSWDEPGAASSMEQKFLAQYLAQRLNQISGMQSEFTLHDVMAVPSYAISGNYLDLANPFFAPGREIIEAIEDIEDEAPPYEFEIMKDVCDWLNNLWM